MTDPIDALRARGIDNAEELLEYGAPDEILAACHRWDARKGVGPGLLARWIRNREFKAEPASAPAHSRAEEMRARFDEYASRYPEGSVAEPHHRLQVRRRYHDDDPCPGSLIVVDTIYPLLALKCDECGFLTALTPRNLHILDGTAF